MGYYDEQFDKELLPAEAIREVRARGCTTPGVAELLVRHYSAHHVLMNLHQIERLLEKIFLEEEIIAEELRELLERQEPADIRDFVLYQLTKTGEREMITGTVAGTSSVFQESPVPASNFIPLQSGPVFTVDDTLVTLSPSPDDDVTKVVAAVASTDTAASYNITVTGVNDKGVTVSHVFNVPILPVPPPAATSITDFTLSQLS
jgi:hypothetical protein